MPSDLLEIALRSEEFSADIFENPDVANSALAVIDRIILFFGDDIAKAKVDGPISAREGFDVAWKLGVKETK